MYMLYGAKLNGKEVEKVDSIGCIVFDEDLESARRTVEIEDLYADHYECYLVEATNYSVEWMLKPHNGGWDYYYPISGTPFIISDEGLNQSWYDFEESADKDRLDRAQNIAQNGSNQAIYDAYQDLSDDRQENGANYGASGTNQSGLDSLLSDFDTNDSGFRFSYSDYF